MVGLLKHMLLILVICLHNIYKLYLLLAFYSYITAAYIFIYIHTWYHIRVSNISIRFALVCIRMHPYTSVCIESHSAYVCDARTYAPTCIHMLPLCIRMETFETCTRNKRVKSPTSSQNKKNTVAL